MAPEIMSFSIMSTVRHEVPVLHREYHVGDFVAKKSHHVMEVGFSTRIAETIAELALMMAGGDVRSVHLLFYPWLEGAWRERQDEDWTTAGTRVFERITSSPGCLDPCDHDE